MSAPMLPTNNNNPVAQMQEQVQTGMSLIEMIRQQQQLTAVLVLNSLMEIKNVQIKIAGQDYDVMNQEVLTEYTNNKMVQFMVKHETYREHVRRVFHLKTLEEEKLIGFELEHIKLKMKSYKRKGEHGIINGLRMNSAETEVIPQNTRRKKFLGLI